MREVLADGSTRLRTPDCCFVFERLRPSVMATSITGEDTGGLGTSPLEEIRAEFSRFRRPVAWFIDARNCSNAANSVSETWTAWLAGNRESIKRLDLLVASTPLKLTVAISTHLARTAVPIKLHESADAFLTAIQTECPGVDALPAVRDKEPSTPVSTEAIDGGVLFKGNTCEYETTGKAHVVRTRIMGDDTGQMINLLLDHMVGRIERVPQPIVWFVDATGCTSAEPRVTETFTAWIAANRSSIRQVNVLTSSNALQWQVSIAKYFAGSDRIIRPMNDRAEFDAEYARLTS